MKQVIWVIVVLLVIWGVYALATGKSSAPVTEQPATGEQATATTTPEASVPANAIDMAEQKVGKSVTVASYTLSAPGFIEVHAVTAEQTPGAILGSSGLLPAGSGAEVQISLTASTKDGQNVIAMLHLDNGDGKFDATTDLPATSANATGGQEVVMKLVAVKK
ncbi:MAG: hypothetical protein WC764_00535 [Candidatus Paceibacterota bacterium]|jgi:hypothetical protein